MRILDTIAVCLTSGKPGDVIAAAFEKSGQVHLVLAKSGEVLNEDYTRAQQFLSTLSSSNHWTDVLPFLIKHSKANLDNRIQNLHQTISSTSSTSYWLRQIRRVKSGVSQLKYFHGCPVQRTTPVVSLKTSCVCAGTNPISKWSQTMHRSFDLELVIVANALRKSAFLAALTVNNRNLTQLEFKARVEKLQRRLGKVCQYTRIGDLIKRVKRVIEVPFSWVNDQLVDAGEGSFENGLNPEGAIQCALLEHVSKIGYQDLDMDAVYKHYPNLGPNWAQHRIFQCKHVECHSTIMPCMLSFWVCPRRTVVTQTGYITGSR